jgi:hypothetical protein
MIVEFRVQRRLDRDLGEHLPELVEIRLGIDAFGRCLSNCLRFFLVHTLPILTHRMG